MKAMNSGIKKSDLNGHESLMASEEQQKKINEVRRLIGPLSGKSSLYCSDASISRYLRARNWNVKKATKMLKETLKWRSKYKPEEISWEEVAREAETGKIYRSNYVDKHGRTVLVMRPSCQIAKVLARNTITLSNNPVCDYTKYLVYCMENAILNLPKEQEQMVWLIDFHGFNLSHISVKVTRETAHVLQEHYPERLGLAILYNAPKFFEPFWTVVKPFLEPKTANKVKFVYSDDPNTRKIMEDLFSMDKLESSFGGNDEVGFDINKYAEMMKEDDKKMPFFWTRSNDPAEAPQPTLTSESSVNLVNSESESDSSDEKAEKSLAQDTDTDESDTDKNVPLTSSSGKVVDVN